MRSAPLKFAAGALIAAVFAVAAPATAADKTTVSITGQVLAIYAFDPGTVHVAKGSTVHWNWASNAPHNVTFKKLGEASDTMECGSFKLRFKQAGTFKYQCTIHGFKGKVVVG